MRRLSLFRAVAGRSCRRLGLGSLALAVAGLIGGSATAQITVRFVDVDAQWNYVDNMTEAYNIHNANLADIAPPYGVFADVIVNVPNIDYQSDGGADNVFGGPGLNRDYPAANNREDVFMMWEAEVTIPAGTYEIGSGSDDGTFVWIDGIAITNQQKVTAGDIGAQRGLPGSMWTEAGRGVQWTTGTINVPTTTTTTIRGGFFERGGGDGLSVAIRDASGYVIGNQDVIDGNNNNIGGTAALDIDPALDNWVLLADGAAGWTVNPTNPDADQPIYRVGGAGLIGRSGVQGVAQIVTERTNGSATSQPGLFMQVIPDQNINNSAGWVSNINAGLNIDSEGVVPIINWDTNRYDEVDNVLNAVDAPNVDIEGNGSFANYSVRLAGEINIPQNGEIQFKDGVDDYAYFAVDMDGDGEFRANEVLINDNAWAPFVGVDTADGVPASPIVTANFTNVEAGGSWRKIEYFMAEGGGGDSAALYWDQNAGVTFPATNTDPAPIEALVPTDSLRTFQEQATAATLAATLTGTSVFDVSVGDLNWDRYTAGAPLALTGDDATIEVNILDPENLASGFTIDLFDDMELSGTFNFSFPNSDEGMWNTSNFISSGGQLTFGGGLPPGIPGDFNDSGLVEQGDLDLVLGNWGSDTVPGTWTNDPPVGIVDQAELDKVLGNWGRNTPGLGTAAGVPEPSSIALLLVVAGLGLGARLARKR